MYFGGFFLHDGNILKPWLNPWACSLLCWYSTSWQSLCTLLQVERTPGGERYLHHLTTPLDQIMKDREHWEIWGNVRIILMERENRHRATTWRKQCLFSPAHQSLFFPNTENLIWCWTSPSRFQRWDALSKNFGAVAQVTFPLGSLVHWNGEIWRTQKHR